MFRWLPALLCAASLCAGVEAGAADSTATAPSGSTRTAEVSLLAPRVHLIAIGEAGNVLVLEGDRSLLLVDTQDPANAAAFDSALARLSPKLPSTIVNTHYHEDHLGGNARWHARGYGLFAGNPLGEKVLPKLR